MKPAKDKVGGPLNPAGRLEILARLTLDDRANGDMTARDLLEFDNPLAVYFFVGEGKANLKTSFNAMFSGYGAPGFPHCSSLELRQLTIVDPNNNPFARPCLFLP